MSNKEFSLHQIGSRNPVTILIPEPDRIPAKPFIGREELVSQCMAAWLDIDGRGPLHFRLSGPPGVGKNALVYHLSREVEKKPIYIMQGHEELAPEDIACTARITRNNEVEYVGSPLLAAMIHGGICFFDEIGKVPSRALSLLASVLDERRSLTSVLAGFTETAHPDFRFCAALNDTDASVYGLPDYIDERLRPAFKVGYPSIEEIMEIISSQESKRGQVFLESFREWIVDRVDISPREALTIIGLAKRLHQTNGSKRMTRKLAKSLFDEAHQHWQSDE